VSDQPAGKRLFVAVNLSIASTRRVAEGLERLRRAGSERGFRVSWVPPANLHVTLKYLGWTRPDAAFGVRDQLRTRLEGKKGFDIEATGTGAFPSTAAARVVWVGVRDPSGALAELAREVDRAMVDLGYAAETRPYHPHVTLGRVREPADVAELLAAVGPPSFGNSFVREMVVYESVTKSNGSEYFPLARVPLGGSPPRTERQTRGVEESSEREEPDHGGERT